MPQPTEGAAFWRLVRDAGVLELNTGYAYLLLASHFGDTCLLAERDGAAVGFVAAYRLPREPQTLFVWQIGVARSEQGRGLGGKLLDALLRQPGCAGVRYLEATVTSSNEASAALFRAFARRHGAPAGLSPAFEPEHFPEPGHEAERRFRIGPLPAPE